MKNYFRIIYIAPLLLLSFSSCKKILDVTNVKPVNQLSEEDAITTVQKAKTVMIGTYGILKGGLEIPVYAPTAAGLMGLTMAPGTSAGTTEAGFFTNTMDPENYYIEAIYTRFYKVLNNANFIIYYAPKIDTQDPAREKVLGEAKFVRALCHFYLLRLYGYFWDQSSSYGIVYKNLPITDAYAEPRVGVKAVYDSIMSDLDYAVTNAPDFTKTFYASKQAAMALKAKVCLYAGKYEEAATVADALIKSGKFSLETEYADIFTKKIVNTKETIFQTPYDDKNDRNNKAYMFRAYYIISDYFASLLEGDTRKNATMTVLATGVKRNNKFNGTVFNSQTLTADTEYFLRLDEIYLILAEALARSGASIEDASKPLNVIRGRAHMPLISAGNKKDLLEAIRKEKILELGAEDGEEWFDLVRYEAQGDLKVKDFKPGAITPNKYVLPIPYKNVQLSNDVVKQNPTY